jgi:hypothetical protein
MPVAATPTCRLVALPLAQLLIEMAPKPASTAGKAPASAAAKVPSKTVEKKKAAKKTAKPPDTSNKAMAILNSFVNDIFKRITGEAPSKSKHFSFSHHAY